MALTKVSYSMIDGAPINVLDLGAVGDGSTDDTAAFQAAADLGGTIFVPDGSYKITSTINVTKGTTFVGSSKTSALIYNYTGGSDCFYFYTTNTAQYVYLADCGFQSISIFSTSAQTTGAGIKLSKCERFSMFDVEITGHPIGLHIQGGQLSQYIDINIIGYGVGSYFAGSTGIKIEEASTAGSTYQPAYTHQFTNIYVGGSLLLDSCVEINSGDGIRFVNCYFNSGYNSIVKFAVTNATQYIAPVNFQSVYFDGVDPATGSQHGLLFASTVVNANVSVFVDGSFIWGCQDNIIELTDVAFNRLNLVNCNVSGTQKWGIYNSGTGAFNTRIQISNSRFENITTGTNNGGIYANNADLIALSNNTFIGITSTGATAISLAGSITSYTATGNVFENNTSNFASTATITKKCVSANTIDQGTFTPVLNFGGGNTGITYTTSIGKYVVVGNTVFASVYMLLSNKGSSTGVVSITGLPFTSVADNVTTGPLSIGSAGSTVGNGSLSSIISGSSTAITLNQTASGTETQLTDASFTNTTYLSVSISYAIST